MGFPKTEGLGRRLCADVEFLFVGGGEKGRTVRRAHGDDAYILTVGVDDADGDESVKPFADHVVDDGRQTEDEAVRVLLF